MTIKFSTLLFRDSLYLGSLLSCFGSRFFFQPFCVPLPRSFVLLTVIILNNISLSFFPFYLRTFNVFSFVTLYIVQLCAFVSVRFLRQKIISYIMIGLSSGRHTFTLMLTLPWFSAISDNMLKEADGLCLQHVVSSIKLDVLYGTAV